MTHIGFNFADLVFHVEPTMPIFDTGVFTEDVFIILDYSELLPQTARRTKVRDAGFGGNSCAGEDDDIFSLFEQKPEFLNRPFKIIH